MRPPNPPATARLPSPTIAPAKLRALNFLPRLFLFPSFFISPSLNRSLSKLTHRDVSSEKSLPLALGESPRTPSSSSRKKKHAETRRHKSTAADFRALAASGKDHARPAATSACLEADASPPFHSRRSNPYRMKIRVRVGCGPEMECAFGRQQVSGRLTLVALAVVVSGAEGLCRD